MGDKNKREDGNAGSERPAWDQPEWLRNFLNYPLPLLELPELEPFDLELTPITFKWLDEPDTKDDTDV